MVTSTYALRSVVVNRKDPSSCFCSSRPTPFTSTPSASGSFIFAGLTTPQRSMIAGFPQPAVSADAGSGSRRPWPSTFDGSTLSRFRHSPVTFAPGEGTAADALSSAEEQPARVISGASTDSPMTERRR